MHRSLVEGPLLPFHYRLEGFKAKGLRLCQFEGGKNESVPSSFLLLVASLLLVVRPGAPSSFLLLVAMPLLLVAMPLAPSSTARSP